MSKKAWLYRIGVCGVVSQQDKKRANLAEEVDRSGVVQPWCEYQKEVVQHHGLVVQVELDGLVIEFDVGHFGDDVLEVRLPPSLGGVGHHGQDSVVILLVLVVQEHKLSPQMSLLRSSKNLK